jgi:ATP-dependent helicase HrpA
MSPKDLEARLEHCLIADRWPLRQALQRLGKPAGAAPDPDKLQALQRLAERVEQSCQRAEARRESRPAVHYPPGLPVSARVDEIKTAIAAHPVVIIAGETGSGKTTQIPKICLDLGRGICGLIGHTQPRRLAARSIAERLAVELGCERSDLVGHQVRFTDTSSERSLIKVMTDGILLAETQHDPWLNRYDTLIIDEAHERSLNIDFLLGYLKRLLARRRDLKVIITSATIEVEKFSAHFGGAPVIEVSGRTFPVTVHYRPPAAEHEGGDPELPEQVVSAFDFLLQLERQQRPSHRDVLVFLSGEKEIRDCAEALRKRQYANLEILPLYARLSQREQNRVFESHAGRRIVLTTNVAETSLTVPGIGYVIDSGWVRMSRYSVRSKIQRLPIEPISRASANQRAGRCGRLAPGVCIRLYSEEDLAGRPAFTDPEILRTNLAAVILQMLALRLGNVEEFPFIEPPEGRAVRDGFRLLEELQAVSSSGELTTLGRQMARLPLDPQLSRVVLEAAQRHALRETLLIVSALSIQDPRERPTERQQAADERHRAYQHPESDFLAFVNLWDHFEQQRQALGANRLRKYCQDQFLSFMRMREWREVHRQLLLLCAELKLPLNPEPATYEEIHLSLLTGFISQVAQRLEEGGYLGARSRKYSVFPGSAVHRKNYRWLVSAELIETSQLFARMNARVEPEWIEKLARHLTKRDYVEPHWEQRRGQVCAYEKVLLFGLVLVERRRINYGPIDPVESRRIFIEEALVGRQLKTRAAFHAANLRLIDKIGELEERMRRRDLLVDDAVISRFYDSKLPASVHDVASLERWYFALPKAKVTELLLTEAELQTTTLEAAELAQFPEQARTASLAVPLSYAFAPGAADDGAAITVPVSALRQLRTEELDWLVPGLLRDKCIALIRALPKALRKTFVPVPDVVDRLLPELRPAQGSLRQALAYQLLRYSGQPISADSWEGVSLPEHLQLLIKVVDDKGALLGQGRDLAALRAQLGTLVQQSINEVAAGQFDRKGLQDWDFDSLPEQYQARNGGMVVTGYPTLVDRGDSVDLCLSDTAAKAGAALVTGSARLAMLQSKKQVRFLQKQLLQQQVLKDPRQLRALQGFGERDKLLDQLILRSFREALRLSEQAPRTQQDFRLRLAERQGEVTAIALRLESLLQRILVSRLEISRRLEQAPFSGPQGAALREDVGRQLAHLLPDDFLLQTPWMQLQELPRFLQAILLRMEKFPTQTARDRDHTQLLDRLWRQVEQRVAHCRQQEIEDAALEEYRWLLEELRVSLFAQQLGTRVSVSEQRLQRFWQEKVGK